MTEIAARNPRSRRRRSPVEDHYNIRPVINIYGGADGKDLGYVSDQIQKLVDASRKDLPRGSFISVRGQVTTMHDSYTGLYVGLAFSILFAYLLMVVNFQSWTQPFIIITALPFALTGIIWMLFATGTTLSVPALMGAITCMGVATANSVLVVTFAMLLLIALFNSRKTDCVLLPAYRDAHNTAVSVAHCEPYLFTKS